MKKIDRERVLPILAEMEELTKALRQIVALNLEDVNDFDFAKHLMVLGTAIVALQKILKS
jgi:hypothetical protein